MEADQAAPNTFLEEECVRSRRTRLLSSAPRNSWAPLETNLVSHLSFPSRKARYSPEEGAQTQGLRARGLAHRILWVHHVHTDLAWNTCFPHRTAMRWWVLNLLLEHLDSVLPCRCYGILGETFAAWSLDFPLAIMDFVCPVHFVIPLFLFPWRNLSPITYGLGELSVIMPFTSQLLMPGRVSQIGPIIVPYSLDFDWLRGGQEPKPWTFLLDPGGKALFFLQNL